MRSGVEGGDAFTDESEQASFRILYCRGLSENEIPRVFLAIPIRFLSYPTASLKHMFGESSSPVTVDVAVKQLADAVDTLLVVDLGSASRDELLELARGLETQRRRLPAADHTLIGELDDPGGRRGTGLRVHRGAADAAAADHPG